MKTATELMDEADAVSLLPEKRARCQQKEDLVRRTGRSVPTMPAFEAGDTLGECDALDLQEARLNSTLKAAKDTLKDPLSPSAVSDAKAFAERQIQAAEAVIKAAGGDVPARPHCTGGAWAECGSLQTHAKRLMRMCQEAGLDVPQADSESAGGSMTLTERAMTALGTREKVVIPITKADGTKMTLTEQVLATKAANPRGKNRNR